ncbi:MAG: SoxR reducing system RseC family protein [Gammaproteobacteria bacterium]|nr:SoxR reducing system RseC family protein [Gammaproteobacteria bacterium]
MIEERGQVVSAEGEFAWIETYRKTACQSCSVNKGCGTGALSDYLGKRMDKVKVLNPVGAKIGDKVVVGLQESALLRGSLAIYFVPLVLMIIGALVGGAVAVNLGYVANDGVTAVAGLLGLALGFVWVRFFSSRIAADSRYQLLILRLDHEAGQCNIIEGITAKEAM